MIRVVTIEREYGSGGADIAKLLAERLDWKLWDQRLTDEIATRRVRKTYSGSAQLEAKAAANEY